MRFVYTYITQKTKYEINSYYCLRSRHEPKSDGHKYRTAHTELKRRTVRQSATIASVEAMNRYLTETNITLRVITLLTELLQLMHVHKDHLIVPDIIFFFLWNDFANIENEDTTFFHTIIHSPLHSSFMRQDITTLQAE